MARRNNFSTVYTNYRKLDFWKELYEEKDNDFKKEFYLAMKEIKNSTKAYLRYSCWSEIFKKLPKCSYLSCTVPNSYWRLLYKKDMTILFPVFNFLYHSG